MSGGKDRKSKSSKAQGWEEAGGEFYQECYPGDLENLQRDPAALATLLPSKQNRAATTRRVRPNNQDTKNTRKRQGTATARRRSSQATYGVGGVIGGVPVVNAQSQLTSNRRNSQYADIQVSMLPDLSQDLTDEERIWEEIMEIKTMPVSMAQKREMKAQLQSTTTLRLKGLDQIKWQRRKFWQQFLTKWSEILKKMELWRYSLKCIEGNFGTGVVAYFLFLRWLMCLNLVIFILIFSFVVLPQSVLHEPKDKPCDLINESNSTQCCYEDYMKRDWKSSMMDIIQGTGFMERTLLFYGNYTNKIFGYHPYGSPYRDKGGGTKTTNDVKQITESSLYENNDKKPIEVDNPPNFLPKNFLVKDENGEMNNKNKATTLTSSSTSTSLPSTQQMNQDEDDLQQLTENYSNTSFLTISGNATQQNNTKTIDIENEDIDEVRMLNASQQQQLQQQPDNSRSSNGGGLGVTEYVTNEMYYDLPLAYVSVAAVYFLISLAAIVKSASREFKDRLVDGEGGQFYEYCNIIFGGWDFCIQNEKSADIKHKALFNEIKSLLYSKRMEYERHNRSRDYMCKLIMIRFIINIIVIIILILSAALIYFLFNKSLSYLDPTYKQSEPLSILSNLNLYKGLGITNDVKNDGNEYSMMVGQQAPEANYLISDKGMLPSNDSIIEEIIKESYNLKETSQAQNHQQLQSLSSSILSSSEETDDTNYMQTNFIDKKLSSDEDENKFSNLNPFIRNSDSESIFSRAGAGNNENYPDLVKQLETLFYEFLPYIGIVCLNLLVPSIFNYLCEFEQYSPMFVIKISLLRTVFLRLSSLAVLLSKFYFSIIPKEDDNVQCYKEGKPQCWETFVGQQFYKLVITDFVTHILVTFFINFPRSLIAKHVKTKFARLVGEQEFELTKHVLDVVYSQTLCWLGAFYAPFLPAIATIIAFFMFYIKKFQCLVNSKPSIILYRASRSNSLFMFILLLSFVIAIIPVVYAIAEIPPSKSCGPFRGLNSVWDAAINAFTKMPSFFQNFIFFLGTAGFAIPCFIILTLFLYYYYAVSDANKHMVEVLKNQLVLEGHDKQFLLNRLSSFIKQQQDFQKKIRQYDPRMAESVIPPNVAGQPQQSSQQQQPSQTQSQQHSHRDSRSSRERNRPTDGGGGGTGD